MKKINRLLNQFLSKDSFFYFLLIRIYYYWKPTYLEIDDVLSNYSKLKSKIFFIQIGANEGKKTDPLYNYISSYRWEGVLVEPVKFLFEKLESNYKMYSEQLFFENVAIGKEDGKQIFYYVKAKEDIEVPFWAEELGSFDKEVILKHKIYIAEIESLIIEEEVQVTSISNLQKKYDIKELDILMIDTEGYDFNILITYPFYEIVPDIIIYEHKHLGNTRHKESLSFLRKHCYKLFSLEGDTLAIQKKYLKKFPSLLDGAKKKYDRERVVKMLRFNNSH